MLLANNNNIMLQYISVLCGILIALLIFAVIFGWEVHAAPVLLIVLIATLMLSITVFGLLNYKNYTHFLRKRRGVDYQALQHLYHKSSLLREMITLLQTSTTLDDACKIVSLFAKQLFPSTAGIVIMTDYHGVWQSRSHWNFKHLRPVSFMDNECWAVRSYQMYEVMHENEKPLCPHVHRLKKVHYPHFCMPLDKNSRVSGILFVQLLDETISPTAYQELKRDIELFVEQVLPGLVNIQLNEKLRQQSLSDPLTGLYNRRFFMSALDNEIARAKRRKSQFSLVIMDIDHFKKYNDSFGHEAGDRILQKLSDILRVYFRESDIICRYGGEEFIVLMPETGLEDAQKRCEKLMELIHSELFLPALPKSRKVTVSIGISVFPHHSRLAEHLINKADKALYEAKAQGRNQIKISDA